MTKVILGKDEVKTVRSFDELLELGNMNKKAKAVAGSTSATIWASFALLAHEEGQAAFNTWYQAEMITSMERAGVKRFTDVEGNGALRSAASTVNKAFRLGMPLAKCEDGEFYTITKKGDIKEDESAEDMKERHLKEIFETISNDAERVLYAEALLNSVLATS